MHTCTGWPAFYRRRSRNARQPAPGDQPGWIGDYNPTLSYYQLPDFDINYGWGDRIQLKYELPIAASTDQNNTTRAGLGESLLGIKWRLYEYYRAGETKSDENMLFSPGTYPHAIRTKG